MGSGDEGNVVDGTAFPRRCPEAFDGQIYLRNLEHLGLKVYERIWDVICKRYSYARSHTSVNLYGEELTAQTDLVRSLYKSQIQVEGGTQEATVKALHDLTDFLNSEHGDVVHVLGPHGCGKSTVLARFIVDKELVNTSEAFMEEQESRKSLKTYIRAIIAVFRLTKNSKFGAEATPIAHDCVSQKAWDRIKETIGSALVKKKEDSSEELDDFLDRFEMRVAGDHDALGSEYDSEDQNEQISQIEVPSKIDKELLHHVVAQIHRLVHRRLPVAEIAFRAHHALSLFFIKRPSHSTNHMLSHLCSSVLQKQDIQAPSWRRFEQLLRQVIEPPELSDKEAAPVLLILDGITKEERREIRRIVLAFQGRVRAVISIDPASLQDEDQTTYQGLRKSTTTITISPLAYGERNFVFSCLIDRIAPKKRPCNTNVITSRPTAGSPLYLTTVAGYLSACQLLNSQPEPFSLFGTSVVEILCHQFLPAAERRMGVSAVKSFVSILNHDPLGHDRKEIRAMLHACDVDLADDRLRILMEAFRPFADTASTMSEDHMVMTRQCMHEACHQRYVRSNGGLLQGSSELDAIRELVQKQDMRIARMRQGHGLTPTTDTLEEAEDVIDNDDDVEWFSDEEDTSWIKSLNLGLGICDEIDMSFGAKTLKVDRSLFFSYCSNEQGPTGGERDSTMDLNEFLKMLRVKGILPTYVTKSQAADAFKKANLDHKSSKSTDQNKSEMDFAEFSDCMQRLYAEYR